METRARSLAFHPKGYRLATGGGMDRTVKLWDLATGRDVLTLRGHEDSVNAVLFVDGGNRLISTEGGELSRPSQIRIWDATPLPAALSPRPHGASPLSGLVPAALSHGFRSQNMRTVRTITLAAALCASCLLVTDRSFADEPAAPKLSAEDLAQAQVKSKAVELVGVAYQLAEIGRETRSPETLVAAGGMLRRIHLQTQGKLAEPTDKVTDEAGKELKTQTAATPSFEAEANRLFTEASDLAAEMGPQMANAVDTLIKAARERKCESRDAVGGPKAVTRVIKPGETQVYTISFYTGRPAAFSFRSTDAPLRCKLRWEGYVHFEQVVKFGQYGWVPDPKGGIAAKTYVISIHNETKRPTTYSFFAN